MIEYQLILSNRRTLSICVDLEGALVVRAPLKTPRREIEAFLTQKQSWIEEKQKLAQLRRIFSPQDGGSMPWMDGMLKIRRADVRAPERRDDVLYVPMEGELYPWLRQWRMQKAKEILPPRVAMWSEKTGIPFGKLTFGQARKRWGSMNSSGDLRLNAALLHCPVGLIDYVIVHELCHALHFDHSPAFHASVRSFLPDAEERRKILKACSLYTTLLHSD